MSNEDLKPEQKTAADRYADLYESQVMDALLNGSLVHVQTEMRMGTKTMPIEMNIHWPTVGDYQEIGRLTTYFLGGIEPRLAVARDLALARARAYVEVLGEAPFPSWLPPHNEPSQTVGPGGQLRTTFRPDTSGCRMPQALIDLYHEMEEVTQRFQHLGY